MLPRFAALGWAGMLPWLRTHVHLSLRIETAYYIIFYLLFLSTGPGWVQNLLSKNLSSLGIQAIYRCTRALLSFFALPVRALLYLGRAAIS